MSIARRTIVTMLGGTIVAPTMVSNAKATVLDPVIPNYFGLIGQIKAIPGKRDELIGILGMRINDMPGCISYFIAKDAKDIDAIWVTEVWSSSAEHKASLDLPVVKDAIAKGRPLIAGFGAHHETIVIAGKGI